jgi:serine/threonine protein kinase
VNEQIYRLYKTSPDLTTNSMTHIHTGLFLYKEIYRMILGLTVLNHHQLLHNDVRHKNILINPKTGQLRLIDYSITLHYKNFFKNLTHMCKHENHVYPPEMCLLPTFKDKDIPYLGSHGGLRPNIRKYLLDFLNTIGFGKNPEELLKLINLLKANGETEIIGFLKTEGDLLHKDIRNRELILMLLDLQNIRTQEDFKNKLFFTLDTYMLATHLRTFIHTITKYHLYLENMPLIQGLLKILNEMKNPRLSMRLTGKEALRKMEELRYTVGGNAFHNEFRRVHRIPQSYLKYIIS